MDALGAYPENPSPQEVQEIGQSLIRLYAEEEPPPPHDISAAQSKAEQILVMEARFAANVGLFNRADAIHKLRPDRMVEKIKRRRNGSDDTALSLERIELCHEPTEVETFREELIADLAARLNSRSRT